MFKRLFGKKQASKPTSLLEAKEILIESISEESQNKHVGESFNNCLELLADSTQEEVSAFSESMLELAKTLPVHQASIAMSVCTGLVERGFCDDMLVEKLVNLFSDHLKNALPFFKLLDAEVKKGEAGDLDVGVDVDSLHYELLRNRELVEEKVAKSVLFVEQFAQSLISILTIDSSHIKIFKDKLKDDILFVKDYSQGSYWILKSLDLLFDDPIVVIDVDNHIGFEAKMSGVSDNFQLQHLLMTMPELNTHSAINSDDLTVINGTGFHISNSMIEGKWNMYNYEACQQEDWLDIKRGPAKTLELKDFWIWGEGSPQEISVYNGRRVVFLGRPTYKRTTKVQRTFKNMKAGIEIERMLDAEEINTWLGIEE